MVFNDIMGKCNGPFFRKPFQNVFPPHNGDSPFICRGQGKSCHFSLEVERALGHRNNNNFQELLIGKNCLDIMNLIRQSQNLYLSVTRKKEKQMFQKQEQAFIKSDWTAFRQLDEKQKKKAIPMPQKSFFSVGTPVIQRKVYRYESGQWIAVRDHFTQDRVDPNAANIPGEEGQYYDGAIGNYVNQPTVMAGAIIRAQGREQTRFQAGADPRNHAAALSHISMSSYSKSAPLSVQTPTGEASWRKSFCRGSGAMSHEKQPYVFQENQTLSSTYTALSQVMDGMEPEERGIILEAMMRFFSSNDPIERIELPTATPAQREAATLITAILAAENHMTRTPVGGKLERAVIRMLQSGGTFHQALNSTDGDFVQSQVGGNKVMRQALSSPYATPVRFKGMGRILPYMSDSSAAVSDQEDFSEPPSVRSRDGTSGFTMGTISEAEMLVVRYVILLYSDENFANEDPDLLGYLYENVYRLMDAPDTIAPEVLAQLRAFIQRHSHG